MKYKSFYIKNYKGIKDLKLELDKDPNSNIITLVGLNESGKTSILEAISLIHNEPNANEVHKLIPNPSFLFPDRLPMLFAIQTRRGSSRLSSVRMRYALRCDRNPA